MRSRNIKPGFYKNDILAECDPLARVLFTGLWCMADREGRLEYRTKKIKVELLPYDQCDVDNLLKQLSDKNFITVYLVNNEKYIQKGITNVPSCIFGKSIFDFSINSKPEIIESSSTIREKLYFLMKNNISASKFSHQFGR